MKPQITILYIEVIRKRQKLNISFRHVITVVLTTICTLSLLSSRQKNKKNHSIEGFVIQIQIKRIVELIFRIRIRRKFVILSIHCHLSLFSLIWTVFIILPNFALFDRNCFLHKNLNATW